ncbi:MAG TPA: DUF5606 domain-containing protein [Chitinophagaceae bacterium]|nr:DUF5606 domain-containing protein [Chitinophagaceae bacterium]
MDYSKLVAVTGLPGLYELINSKTDGAIVRSLDDKSTRFVASRSHNFSHLESIEVFTVGDNVNLAEIFFAMDKEGGSLPDTKDESAIKKYFQKTYPDLDFERVYTSDLKKMVKWFDVLKKNDIEIKLPEEAVEEPEEEIAPAVAMKEEKRKVVKEKTVSKTAKKSASSETPKAAKKETPAKEEKPKKSTKKTSEKTPKKKGK